MTRGQVNNKLTQIALRVPNDVIELMEATKEEGETVGKYIVTAITNEAMRRQRKKNGEK